SSHHTKQILFKSSLPISILHFKKSPCRWSSRIVHEHIYATLFCSNVFHKCCNCSPISHITCHILNIFISCLLLNIFHGMLQLLSTTTRNPLMRSLLGKSQCRCLSKSLTCSRNNHCFIF